MNLSNSELLFLFRPRKIDFVLVLSATSLFKEFIFTTLLKACGIQNDSHIYLHQRQMEEYYYPEQAQSRKAQNQTPFVHILSNLCC